MSEPAQQPVVHDEAWPIVLGPEIAGEAVSRREWLETNGLGGWAASTVSGAHSRRCHGLLVAAMDPPVGCLVMLSRREETIVVDVDGVSGNHDSVVRPNQLFALSPPFPLVESEWARRVLEVARQQLATSRGLRSLSPEDPQYRGHYGGDPLARDGAYHQGTVWGWLIGPYLTAWMRHSGSGGRSACGSRWLRRPSARRLYRHDRRGLRRRCAARAQGHRGTGMERGGAAARPS